MTASASLRGDAQRVRNFQHDALKKHGGDLRKALIKSAKSATGGDRKLSGMGPHGPRLGVTLRTSRGSSITTVTIRPSPKAAKAPWRWIQDGTAPGLRSRGVGSRRAGVSRRQQQFSGGAGTFGHPGTDGSNAWRGPVEQEIPRIRADMQSEFSALFR